MTKKVNYFTAGDWRSLWTRQYLNDSFTLARNCFFAAADFYYMTDLADK